MIIPYCVICGSYRKNHRFPTCKKCAESWGFYKKPNKDMPGWVKALRNEENIFFKTQKRIIIHEIATDPMVLQRIIEDKQTI